ncbi:hypothetical protein LEMA_P097820.1 [Plenodomus lingam JN3]|uniref:SprT-like domain-containing protein n=1 Tax=Leptosphaeria maculans (strain JN3 / isolate v23.1.3 / race Av1-4-5-6-7-8) TaxID=985895 RepID=E5A428_LEPMJ|nr:hypothetical protein LEMA_P097820.1 [Plenodomus lingam JN3]CBX98373.1 hypothetical protein LEMA_P097820.1 [Plenodomus lingam JN3]
MARLRKPSPYESTFAIPSKEARATRSSPRKATRSLRYADSSDEDDEIPVLIPKSSSRALRQADSPSHNIIPYPIPHSCESDALTPRKQRVLRPIESNSRLLREPSAESLAKLERRGRRVRSGTMDTNLGKRTGLLYAKSLARSVAKKQAEKGRAGLLEDSQTQEDSEQPWGDEEPEQQLEEDLGVEAEEEHETSLLCGDEILQQTEDSPADEESSETDEGEPVVTIKQRRRQQAVRRVVSDSDDDDESEEMDEEKEQCIPQPLPPISLRQKETAVDQQAPTLTSMRPPHRKGKSTISNWAQEVVDLTSSPEPPASFILPPPTRTRTESFAASSRPTSSMSSGALAILTYSPTPTKQRSPHKAPPISRPGTPPLAPPSPTKLVSPSKKKPAIPKATDLHGRPSLDDFWNPAAVNEWNEHHSPVKPLVSPKKQKWREDIVKMMEGVALEDSGDEGYESPTTASPKKKPTARSPTKKQQQTTAASIDATPDVKAIRAQRKAFADRKHDMAASFLAELDNTISQGRISALSAPTGGIKLIWSKTLKTTAGRANWRREQLRLRTGPLPTDTRLQIRHHCSIELAEKVIDDQDRLYNVLAHEFCHLATFMISEVRNQPHGADFKAWGRKASVAFAHLGVEVTTKHSYQIEYKYVWECIVCGYEFKRHSKSVDPARHSCGKCKGRLVQTKPTPRGAAAAAAASATGNGTAATVSGKQGPAESKSEYQNFVKVHFKRVKADLQREGKDAHMGRVMEVLGREYREAKARKAEKEKGKVGSELEGVEAALDGLKI